MIASGLTTCVPKDKHDHAAVERAIAAGYPAVAPVLPQLLTWVQDMNWPVAQQLAPFLGSIGPPLAPYIRDVFATEDETWKYWMFDIIQLSPDLALELLTDVTCIVEHPTPGEQEEALDEKAREFLHRLKWRP